MRVLFLVGVRVGLLGGLIASTDVLLGEGVCRDLAVLVGQLVVEWLLLGRDVGTNPAREVKGNQPAATSEAGDGGRQ